jgi:hypothetical protein
LLSNQLSHSVIPLILEAAIFVFLSASAFLPSTTLSSSLHLYIHSYILDALYFSLYIESIENLRMREEGISALASEYPVPSPLFLFFICLLKTNYKLGEREKAAGAGFIFIPPSDPLPSSPQQILGQVNQNKLYFPWYFAIHFFLSTHFWACKIFLP